ncbi:hypothetical protein ASF16_02990 [Acidovorax sp. Leaf78]|nr:hypothetical protein ASF16_02990 [Acidovorax sp. Leaf78]
MVVVSILAILTALALPSFRPLMERWRVREAAENLQSTIYFARSEAIKRSGSVIIEKSPNSGPCTTATANNQWGCGWNVFFDADGNGTQGACIAANNPNECTLQVVAAPTRISINLPGNSGKISVDRWGMLSHTGGANAPTAMFFDLMPQGKTLADSNAARICVSSGGRITRKMGNEAC